MAALTVLPETPAISAMGEKLPMARAIGGNSAVLDIREEITNDLVDNLEAGAQTPVETGLDEQAAQASFRSTRGALAGGAPQIAVA